MRSASLSLPFLAVALATAQVTMAQVADGSAASVSMAPLPAEVEVASTPVMNLMDRITALNNRRPLPSGQASVPASFSVSDNNSEQVAAAEASLSADEVADQADESVTDEDTDDYSEETEDGADIEEYEVEDEDLEDEEALEEKQEVEGEVDAALVQDGEGEGAVVHYIEARDTNEETDDYSEEIVDGAVIEVELEDGVVELTPEEKQKLGDEVYAALGQDGEGEDAVFHHVEARDNHNPSKSNKKAAASAS